MEICGFCRPCGRKNIKRFGKNILHQEKINLSLSSRVSKYLKYVFFCNVSIMDGNVGSLVLLVEVSYCNCHCCVLGTV